MDYEPITTRTEQEEEQMRNIINALILLGYDPNDPAQIRSLIAAALGDQEGDVPPDVGLL